MKPEAVGMVLFTVFVVIPFVALCFLSTILRHRRKMALIERGINPEEPNPLKTLRRGLVFFCVGIGAGVLMLAKQDDPNAAGFWAAVSILCLAVGIAYLIFYRAVKRTTAQEHSLKTALPDPPKVA